VDRFGGVKAINQGFYPGQGATMPIEAECPLCGHKGNVPDKFDNQQVKCPECCNLFIVTGKTVPAGAKTGGSQSGQFKIMLPGGGPQKNGTSGSSSGQMKAVSTKGTASGQMKVKPASPTHQGTVKKPGHGSSSGQMKAVPSGSASGQQKISPKPPSAQGTVKKPAAAAKPSVKPAARSNDPFGGLTFDDPQGQKVMRRKRRGKSFGNFLALLALLVFLGVVGTGGWLVYRHFSTGGKVENLMSGILASLTPAKPPEEIEPTTKEAEPEPEPGDPEPKPMPAPAALVFDASKGPATIASENQSVQVKVVGVTFDVPPVKALENKDKKFMVMVEVENKGQKEVSFQGWGTLEAINELHEPVLTDAGGAPFKRITFPGGADGQALAEDIQPGKTVRDLIIFEPPPSGTPFVRLELSADNFGDLEKRKFTLLIPQVVLAKAGMPKPPPKVEPKPEPKPMPAKDPIILATLKTGLANANLDTKLDALKTLVEFGPAGGGAAPEVAKLLKDKSETVRSTAAECLGQFGPRGAAAIPQLIEAMQKDELAKVRGEAAKSLGLIGAPAKEKGLPALNARLAEEKNEAALEGIKDAIQRLEKGPAMEAKAPAMEKDKP